MQVEVLHRPMLCLIANAAETEQTGSRRENAVNYSTAQNFPCCTFENIFCLNNKLVKTSFPYQKLPGGGGDQLYDI